MRVGRELDEKGEGVLVARRAKAKASSDLMSTILHSSADAAFRCASQVMAKNQIVIPATDIQDEMYERAATTHVKTFTEGSAHAPFLQGMRENGRVGSVVNLPGGEEVDTRAFGSSRARHRETNNRLKTTGVVVLDGDHDKPSLYPCGRAPKKTKGDDEYFAAGMNVTPTPMKSGGSSSRLPIDLSVCDSANEDGDVECMVKRVHRRAFIDSGVVQEVIDVESSLSKYAPSDKAEKMKWLYRSMHRYRETTRGIVGNTIDVRPDSTSLDVLKVVNKFLGDDK